MHLTTILVTAAALFSTACAKKRQLFDPNDRFDARPSEDCYCKLYKPHPSSGNDIKELGVTKYCCDVTAGVDDPNVELAPGQEPNWNEKERACNPAVVGLKDAKDVFDVIEQDTFALCCAAMFTQSSCRDPEKLPYTQVEMKGLDENGKLMFGNIRAGGEPPVQFMPELKDIKTE